MITPNTCFGKTIQRRFGVLCVLFFSAFVGSAWSQTEASMPSKDEIFELLAKANEKASNLDKAVRLAKPQLDKVDPKLAVNYLNAASSARVLIEGIKTNGPSAYRLVALLATLDDLSLDAMTGSTELLLLKAGSPQKSEAGFDSVGLLITSKNECNDISELIMHATLRLINSEEDILRKLSSANN